MDGDGNIITTNKNLYPIFPIKYNNYQPKKFERFVENNNRHAAKLTCPKGHDNVAGNFHRKSLAKSFRILQENPPSFVVNKSPSSKTSFGKKPIKPFVIPSDNSIYNAQNRTKPDANIFGEPNKKIMASKYNLEQSYQNDKQFALKISDNDMYQFESKKDEKKLGENPQYIYNAIKFWIEDPSCLIQTLDIVPNAEMTNIERLNAMTRVIIVISAIMFILKFPLWWLFLGLGIIVVVVLWYIIKERENFYGRKQREYIRKPRKKIIEPIDPTNNVNSPINDVNNQQLNIVSRK